MLYRGLLITNLSGAIDGAVASRNRGGPYFRNRTIPVDPNTTQQGYARAAMVAAASAWNSMSTAERGAWDRWARGRKVVNLIGDERTLTGRNAFMQQILPRFTLSAAGFLESEVPTTPPTLPSDDQPAPPVLAITGATSATLAWTSSGWETGAGSTTGLVVHLSPPQAGTVNWYGGPFALLFYIPSNPFSAPTSPQTLTLPVGFQPAVGQRLFARVRLLWDTRPNGHVFQVWDER